MTGPERPEDHKHTEKGDGGDGHRTRPTRTATGPVDLADRGTSDIATRTAKAIIPPQEGEPVINGVTKPTIQAVGFSFGDVPVVLPGNGKTALSAVKSADVGTPMATASATAGTLSLEGNAVVGQPVKMQGVGGAVEVGGDKGDKGRKPAEGDGNNHDTGAGARVKPAEPAANNSGGDTGGAHKPKDKDHPKAKESDPDKRPGTIGGEQKPPKDKPNDQHDTHREAESAPKKDKDKPQTQSTDNKNDHKPDNKNEQKDDHKNDGRKDEKKDDHKDAPPKQEKNDGPKADVKNEQKDHDKHDKHDKEKHDDSKNESNKDKDKSRDNDRATNEKLKENDRDRHKDKEFDKDHKQRDRGERDPRERDIDRERVLRGREEGDRKHDPKLRDDREGRHGEKDHDDKGRLDDKLTAARLHQILRDVEDRITKPGDRRVFSRDPKEGEGRDQRDGKSDRSGRSNDAGHHDHRQDQNDRRVGLAMAIREMLDMIRRGAESNRTEHTQRQNPRGDENRPNRPDLRPPERPEIPNNQINRNDQNVRPERPERPEPNREQFVRTPDQAAALAAIQQMLAQQQRRMEQDGTTPHPGELTPGQMAAILNGLNNEQLQALLDELEKQKEKDRGRRHHHQPQQPTFEEGERRPIKKQETDEEELPQQRIAPEKKEDEEEKEERPEETDQTGGRQQQFVLVNGVLVPVQPNQNTQNVAGTTSGGSSDPTAANNVAAIFIDPNSVLPGLNLDFGEPAAEQHTHPEAGREASFMSSEAAMQTNPMAPTSNAHKIPTSDAMTPYAPSTSDTPQPIPPRPIDINAGTHTTTQPFVSTIKNDITVADIQKFLQNLLGQTDPSQPQSTNPKEHGTSNLTVQQHLDGKPTKDSIFGTRSNDADVTLATLLNDARKSRNYVMDQLIATMEGRKQHVVKEGESLEDIAKRMFGDDRIAELIYKMNSKHIPAKMIAGWKVRVKLVPNLKLVMPTQQEVDKHLAQLKKEKAGTRKKYEYEPARTTVRK